METQETLLKILLGGVLGLIGQSIRVIVGLKKINDRANLNQSTFGKEFETKTLLISLLIGFVAGALAALSIPKEQSSNEAIIAIGYSGTDFIEGFMRKYLPTPQPTPAPLPNPPQN